MMSLEIFFITIQMWTYIIKEKNFTFFLIHFLCFGQGEYTRRWSLFHTFSLYTICWKINEVWNKNYKKKQKGRNSIKIHGNFAERYGFVLDFIAIKFLNISCRLYRLPFVDRQSFWFLFAFHTKDKQMTRNVSHYWIEMRKVC